MVTYLYISGKLWTNFIFLLGCSKVQALEAASLHPAQLLQISDRKGTLNYGADADIILLNDDLEVQATFIAGNLEWLNNTNTVVRQIFKDYKKMIGIQ